MTPYLDTNLLAIRPTESFNVQEQKPENPEPWERVYMVAFVSTPPIEEDAHPECLPLAVICAEYYPTLKSKTNSGWGWVALDHGAKKVIGSCLEAIDAEAGKWYWFILDTRRIK